MSILHKLLIFCGIMALLGYLTACGGTSIRADQISGLDIRLNSELPHLPDMED